MDADRGDLAEALRPFYLDYLAEHERPSDLYPSSPPKSPVDEAEGPDDA